MREEFHGIDHANGTYTYKQLYGWGTLTANVWLPSMSELAGYHPRYDNPDRGTYSSAMKGLNVSGDYYVDPQGGNQFTYFTQYNAASGGGEKLWALGGSHEYWLRSTSCAAATHIYRMTNPTNFNHTLATGSRAVHPAHRNKFHIPRTGFHFDRL